jgi:hypothetical protein
MAAMALFSLAKKENTIELRNLLSSTLAVRRQLHFMRKLALAFMLAGCASMSPSTSRLPTYLVGEWVTPDFKTKDNDREPNEGFVIYLSIHGRAAWVIAPELGGQCRATYNPATGLLTLRDLVPPFSREHPEKYYFIYNAKEKTLMPHEMNPPSDGYTQKDYKRLKLKRRRMELPAYFWKLHWWP